jgi:sirohydrochlorin ferrochelatase
MSLNGAANGRARPETAVVLAAHGDRGGAFANTALLAHRSLLADSGCFAVVTAGVLKGEPTLESALAEAKVSGASRVVVYPFFMADGFFVRTRLSERVAAAGLTGRWEIFPPLGVDPGLPDLMLTHAESAAAAAGFDPAATTLVVAGHGSKFGPASADATRAVASAIEDARVFASVTSAFLEEPPSIEEALRAATEPVVVSGFFSGDGMHAADDVPAAVAKSKVKAIYAGPIGGEPAVGALILSRLRAAIG